MKTHVLTKLLPLAAAVALTGHISAAGVILDDFNDGNDAGWTHVSPLTPFGAAGAYAFPGGGYSINAPASPNPGAVGPGRAGALRMDQLFGGFDAWVDVIDWNAAEPDMVFGLVGRVGTPGIGTTTGYGLTYNNVGRLSLVVITAEASTTLQSTSISLAPGNDYRLHFSGVGADLTGEVFNLSGGAPLATIGTSDATYASGATGVFVYDTSTGGNHTAGATFDNFSAVPEPGSALLSLAALGLMARRRR